MLNAEQIERAWQELNKPANVFGAPDISVADVFVDNEYYNLTAEIRAMVDEYYEDCGQPASSWDELMNRRATVLMLLLVASGEEL